MESVKRICSCVLCGKRSYEKTIIEDSPDKLFFDGPDCFTLYKRFISIYGGEFSKFLGFSNS